MIFGNIKHDATITEIELSSVFFCTTFANFLRGSMLSTKLSQTRVLHVVDLFVFCGILASLLAWISVSVTVVILRPQYSLSVKRSVERSSVCKLELSTTYALSRPRKKRFQIVFRELNWSLAILSCSIFFFYLLLFFVLFFLFSKAPFKPASLNWAPLNTYRSK